LGDTVLDPFLGSGTTCKVAKALGRKSTGYEIDTSYKPEIEKRIRSVQSIGLSLDAFTANGKKESHQITQSIPISFKSSINDLS
jgi:DNA modification methylase